MLILSYTSETRVRSSVLTLYRAFTLRDEDSYSRLLQLQERDVLV